MTTFLAFLLGYILSQFFRSFLAVIAPELAAELHIPAAGLGHITAAWFAAFAVSQFFVGPALDRIGPRRTTAMVMLAGVAGSLIFARATSGTEAIIAMALIGVGCSAALMGPLYVFGRVYPFERFTMLSAAMIGFGNIGNLLGGTPLALASEAFGWRAVFVVLAVVMLAVALIIYVLVSDPPRAGNPDGADRGWWRELASIMSNRSLWPIWPMMGLAYGVLITERGLWVGPYLADVHGLDPVPRGHVILAMALAIIAGALASGPLERWTGTRKWLGVASGAVPGIALLALALLENPNLTTVTALLCMMGLGGMNYSVVMAHIRSFIPEHTLGRGITFANFLCMGGAGVLQFLSGYYAGGLKEAGVAPAGLYAELHLVLALILLVITAVYAFSHEKR